MKLARSLLFLTLILLAACAETPAPPAPTATPTATASRTPPSTATLPPTATSTPLPPTVTPTATWAWQAAGDVICPILLYHQIAVIEPPSRYYVPPADFQAQMEALRDWGYTAIPISLLVQAITEGAALPPRPVVITFDDGVRNVYENAFPIMRALGFPGVVYLIENAVGAENHMTSAQILEMTAAGWEVGSHSKTHLNLMENHDQVYREVAQSRLDLQSVLGVPVETFAYPYGAVDAFVMQKTSNYGYRAAVGLGALSQQGMYNLFYLSRIEVRYGTSVEQFGALLPWSGPRP